MSWEIIDNKLQKEFTFKSFGEALAFVNRVGELAEDMDHHPDMELHSYKKVKIKLFTHSKGVISELDHTLAKKIDNL